MDGRKGRSFPWESDGNAMGVKRMRMCRERCGFLGVLKSLKLRHSVSTGATSVTIRIDLEYPYLQIADNGAGISWSEISEIGKTTFLDLITTAEEVLIETMTESMEKSTIMKFHNKVLLAPKSTKVNGGGNGTFGCCWHNSTPPRDTPKAISCTAESPCHQRHAAGTTFTLTNVQLSIMERFEKFRKNIVNYVKSFAVAHYQIAKSITEKVTSIYNLDGMEFNSMSKASNNIAIEAFWGTKFHHSSTIQLVFINGQPCTNIRLLKTIKKVWKCGGRKKRPVYIVCITIRVTHNENIDHLSNDSVIKDCIEECVGRFKSTTQEVEDGFSHVDNMVKDAGSIYSKSPHFLLDVDVQHKMEVDRDKISGGQELLFSTTQSSSPIQQNYYETSPGFTTNTPSQLTPLFSITATLTQTQPVVAQTRDNDATFLAHLEDQTKSLQSHVSYLQNAMKFMENLQKMRERDAKRIQSNLTPDNAKKSHFVPLKIQQNSLKSVQ
uniref:Uncharacterized protein n=1 Tax=Lutzomyia longipalpis TaxID=7200 RepID=A0A1B0EUZ3_LUTLO